MPANNLTARLLQVFIGADLQDWSMAAANFAPSQERLSDRGLLPFTATLELLPVPGIPESLDPYDNPTRWRPGQPVLVRITNDSGAWVDHPQGRLFILQEPDFPEDGGGISVELGCHLAWYDSFEFDADASGVVVGTPENTAVVAQRLLEANEIPSSVISLGGPWSYSLAIPDGKGTNNSFVQQAGGLAYSDDWRYLYQDSAGNIVAGQLDLSIAEPLITIELGSNDVRYLRQKVEGDPPEQVRVAGPGAIVTPGQNPSTEVAEVIGDLSQFSEGVTECLGISVIARSTTTTSWVTSGDTLIYTTETVQSAPRSAVAVKPGIIDFPCDLIDWRRVTEVKRYNLAQGGRLIRINTTEEQRRFTVSDRVTPLLSFAVVRETEERPTYSGREVVSAIVVEESQARALIDPESDDPFDLIESRRVETNWKQLGPTTWQKSESERIPRAYTNSSPESDPAAAIGTATTTTSSTGQTQPPRAEFWDGGNLEEDIEYQGTAAYEIPGGGSGRTRKALYTVPYGFSQGQCEELAAQHVRLIAGRHRAALLEFPVSNALLSAPPLFPCDVLLPTGERRHYRVDGLTWEHTQTLSKAVGTGILVGVTPAPTEEVPDPAPVPTAEGITFISLRSVRAAVSAPVPTVSATVNIPFQATAAVVAPTPTVSAAVAVIPVVTAAVVAPVAEVSARAVGAVVTAAIAAPVAEVAARAVGAVVTAAVEAPVAEVSATVADDAAGPTYRRPDGTSTYRRPDGTSIYLRP